MTSSISILIPCYNVASTIDDVVVNAYRVGKRVSKRLEILAVNDASTDDTAGKLRKLQKKFPELHIITHTTNQGYGKTIKELYIKAKHAILFSLPGDDQFDADALETLLPYLSHADMILGWRNHRNDSTRRLAQSKIYNTILNILFNLKLHDVNTIRLMNKTLIDTIPLTSDTAFVDAELAIKARRKGHIIAEVPVSHKLRVDKGATGGKLRTTIIPTIIDIFKVGASQR